MLYNNAQNILSEEWFQISGGKRNLIFIKSLCVFFADFSFLPSLLPVVLGREDRALTSTVVDQAVHVDVLHHMTQEEVSY